MTFLQPAMLWGLLALSIPIIIHLLNRRRHKTVKWAAMQFLLRATRESRGRKRLRHILILTCRALGIAALATAAALPVISSLLGFGAGRPELVVLVLDRSASMEAIPAGGSVPRRELALQRVRDALAELPGTRLVLVDSASNRPLDIAAPEVLDELSATAATDADADLPALLATATAFLGETPGRSELWIASDLQASNWKPEDDRWTAIRAGLEALSQPPRLRVLALGGASAENQSIRILSSRRAGERLELELELVRGIDAQTPINLPLTTNLDGSRATESLSVAGQRLRFRKTIPIGDDSPRGHGHLSIPGDGNPRDNAAFFAYGPAMPVRSLVVDRFGETADYLALAAAPEGFGGQLSEVVAPAAAGALELDQVAAILWSAPLPDGTVAESLVRFVENGGQLLCFAPEGESSNSLMDLSWSAPGEAPSEQFFVLDSWDRDDGLLRDGIGGDPIPGDRLRAIRRRLTEGEASILARWDDGEPFLIRRIVGRGTLWMIGTRPDYAWSNLGDADVLLPLVQRGVLAGAERFDSGYLAELGAPAAEARPGETRERLDDYGVSERTDPEHLAGVFRFGERLLALNRPANEDLTDIVDQPTLDVILAGTGYSLFEDQATSAREDVTRGIWRAFLIAMLFFLLAEALLCLPSRSAFRNATANTSGKPATDPEPSPGAG